MNINDLQRIYFLGIGGIGMSAIARFFNQSGKEVYGYDLTESILTKKLEDEGMHIHYEDNVSLIPEDIDLVIYTPAIPDDHKELNWLKENNFIIKKRAEVLGLISDAMFTIAVAGTHGKTTTSSLIAHLLTYCGKKVDAFLGGILTDYGSNFLKGNQEIVVVEADEYDRSFLQLSPDYLAIMSLDADHLDIYETVEEMHAAYEDLTYRVNEGGMIFLACDVDDYFSSDWRLEMASRQIDVVELGSGFEYGNIQIIENRFHFEYRDPDGVESMVSGLVGEHNIMNSTVAINIVKSLVEDVDCMKEGLSSFRGIKRRFELLYDERIVLYDDYAHHPNELKFAVHTIKSLYPEKKVLGIFQPHLFSRTLDFYHGFAEELEQLDEIWLLPIYPARELPIEGVRSEMIFNLIRNENKQILEEKEWLDVIKEREDIEVIITLGASDIDKYHEKLIEVLKDKN